MLSAAMVIATLVTEFDDHAGLIAHHLIVGEDSIDLCWQYHIDNNLDGGCVAITSERMAAELSPISPEPFKWRGTRPVARPENSAFHFPEERE